MADQTAAHFSNQIRTKQSRCKRKDTFTLQLVPLKACAVSNAENTACSLLHNESLNHGFQWTSFVTVRSAECLSHIQIGPRSADIDKGSACRLIPQGWAQAVQSLSITSLLFALAPISPECWSMRSQSELSGCIRSCSPSQWAAAELMRLPAHNTSVKTVWPFTFRSWLQTGQHSFGDQISYYTTTHEREACFMFMLVIYWCTGSSVTVLMILVTSDLCSTATLCPHAQERPWHHTQWALVLIGLITELSL